MAYRTAASRAGSNSPADVENHSRGVKLTVSTDLVANGKLNGQASSFKPATSATKYLLHDSEPDDGPLIVRSTPAGDPASNKTNGLSKPTPTAIGTTNGISPTRAKVNFTTDLVPGEFMGGHYIKVALSNQQYDFLFHKLNAEFDWQRAVRAFCVVPDTAGNKLVGYAAFDDVRRAANARKDIVKINTAADVEYITQPQFAAAQKDAQASHDNAAGSVHSSFYDGQIMFYAQFDGHVTACKADGLEEQITIFAQQFGSVLALGELEGKNGMARFRVEYYSIKAAKQAVKTVTAAKPVDIGGWLVTAQELPDLTSNSSSDKGTGTVGRGTPFGSADGSSPTFVSPTGRTAWCLDKQTNEMISSSNNGSNRTSPTNSSALVMHPVRLRPSPPPASIAYGNGHNGTPRHGPNPHHAPINQYGYMPMQSYGGGYRNVVDSNHKDFDSSQSVDVQAIREGRDVRTTIMARNLPNQFTCHVLKDKLELSNHGEYNFSYVRIDYQKGASVGYGFINFVHPDAIITFLEHHGGRPWMEGVTDRHGNERLVEISYATVQGYDCCVEKFRNSSVMTEFVDYRPKLWYTFESAPNADHVGKEMIFPPVNNHTKHQRSLANATQIGLFPPQSRRVLGGPQRNVRSQWDRGTSAQQQEDLMFQMQTQMAQLQMSQLYPHAQLSFPYAGAMAPFSGPQMQPMTVPMAAQQSQYGALISTDAYGNAIWPANGAVAAPNNFVAQAPFNANFNGNGMIRHHPANGRQAARGRGGYRGTIPRGLPQYNDDTNTNGAQGGFNGVNSNSSSYWQSNRDISK